MEDYGGSRVREVEASILSIFVRLSGPSNLPIISSPLPVGAVIAS